MTIKDVNRRVAEVRRLAEQTGTFDDIELVKDEVYVAVLRRIAEGKARNPATLASAALQADAVEYSIR